MKFMKNFQVKAEFLLKKQPLEKILLGDMFEKLSLYEDRYDKDCSEFSFDNIKSFFEEYAAPSETQLSMWCDLLQSYVNYIEENSLIKVSNYADYIKFSEKVDLPKQKKHTTPKQRVINRAMIYGETEFYILRDRLNSRYDKMYLQAIYEGLDFVENCTKLAFLNVDSCDQQNNKIEFPDGTNLSVSSMLLEMLLDCGNNNTYKTNGNNRLRVCGDYNSSSRLCFKNVQISPDMSELEIRKKFNSTFRKIKTALGNDEKISQYSLRMSGYINGLRVFGINSDFDNPQILKRQDAYEWAKRYQLADKSEADYKRTIRRCMIDVE